LDTFQVDKALQFVFCDRCFRWSLFEEKIFERARRRAYVHLIVEIHAFKENTRVLLSLSVVNVNVMRSFYALSRFF
jgi:hypothetical protein